MTNTNFAMFGSIIIGIIIGIIGTLLVLFKRYDAVLSIDTSNFEKDIYNFLILCPLGELYKKKKLIVEVRHTHNTNKKGE